MKHYTKVNIEKYARGDMNIILRTMCAMHLKSCPDCQKVLDSIRDDETLISNIRKAVTHIRETESIPENLNTHISLEKALGKDRVSSTTQ